MLGDKLDRRRWGVDRPNGTASGCGHRESVTTSVCVPCVGAGMIRAHQAPASLECFRRAVLGCVAAPHLPKFQPPVSTAAAAAAAAAAADAEARSGACARACATLDRDSLSESPYP